MKFFNRTSCCNEHADKILIHAACLQFMDILISQFVFKIVGRQVKKGNSALTVAQFLHELNLDCFFLMSINFIDFSEKSK